jgi:hypothetical protein
VFSVQYAVRCWGCAVPCSKSNAVFNPYFSCETSFYQLRGFYRTEHINISCVHVLMRTNPCLATSITLCFPTCAELVCCFVQMNVAEWKDFSSTECLTECTVVSLFYVICAPVFWFFYLCIYIYWNWKKYRYLRRPLGMKRNVVLCKAGHALCNWATQRHCLLTRDIWGSHATDVITSSAF